MKHWHWGLLISIPAVAGATLAVAFWRGWLPNAIFYLRADLGTAFGLLGLLFVVGLGIEWGRWYRRESNRRAIASKVKAEATSERHEFLGRLDHELKNPLMAMRAGLANLAGTTLESPQQEIINSIETQTLRLSRLLTDLRKLAELEIRPIDCAPVDISELLQEVATVAEERPDADSRHIALTLPQAPWPLPMVSGDRDLLFLLFHNLVDNAMKFTQPGHTIELRAFEDGSKVVVEVADTGPGIPDVEVPLVWEELYRGENARGVPGSGIGLALVRAIVERHNGEVFLRSRVGKGTVFTIRLSTAQK